MKSMKQHLFRRFLPLILVPLALVTIWSGTMAWIKGSDGAGFGWTGQGARAFPKVFKQSAELLISRLDAASDLYFHGRAEARNGDEIFVAMDRGRIVNSYSGKDLLDINVSELANSVDLGEHEWDVYGYGKHLFFAARKQKNGLTFLMFKDFNSEYLEHLHEINGAEITLYRDKMAVLSTWHNRNGEMYLPPFTERMEKTIGSNPNALTWQTKDTIAINDYRGIGIGDLVDGRFPQKLEVGASNIYGYRSILAIRSKSKNVEAYLDIAVPQGAAIEGPIYAIFGSGIIFILLAIISTLVVRRVASLYSKPLVAISQGIQDMMESIVPHLPQSPEELRPPNVTETPKEIAILDNAFEKLKRILNAWRDAEDQLLKSKKQLVQSTKMAALGEMAGGVAHEINNPLAVIYTRSRHIQRVLASDPPKLDSAIEFAKIIEAMSDRIAAIVKSLKSFSRSGEADPFEACSVKDIVNDTLTLCAERFKLHGIELQVSEIFEGAQIEGRAVQISQVLLNLLNNAHDAIEALPEKWIKLDVTDNIDSIKIVIIDSGKGIPQSVREKIMQPFFTTKEIGKGTGLGLSVSKGIIDEHQGTLIIDANNPNTCFVITLPKMRRKAA